MAQTIRLTITPEIEKALEVLRQTTMGTLNTTELIKMSIGEVARRKRSQLFEMNKKDLKYEDISPKTWDTLSAKQFYEWAKEDGSLETDNISPDVKLKPFVPVPYVPNR